MVTCGVIRRVEKSCVRTFVVIFRRLRFRRREILARDREATGKRGAGPAGLIVVHVVGNNGAIESDVEN